MELYASIATARVSLGRVQEILDAPLDVREAESPLTLAHVQGDVRFDEVSFTFGRGSPVLERFRLHVQPGEVVAVVGSSGGGKSTIADLLVRQLDPDAGRILLDGQDLRTLALRDVRRNIAVVDQDAFILNASITENIAYARPDARAEELAAAARAAGLQELLSRVPDGLETQVGERGRALSAGERQRIAIARAFIANPAVLVLDEATSALDPVTEAQVVAGYEAVMRGRTTIVITHRLELARLADRIVVLENGMAVEEGTVDELLARAGTFARLFGRLQPVSRT
jgi:ATP-binding cassette subfamily B protein